MAGNDEIEIIIVMNEEGEWDVGCSEDEAHDRFEENFAGVLRRMVRLKVKMSAPIVEDGPSIDVPDTAGSATEVEAA